MIRMTLPFDSKHICACEIEFGAGGQRVRSILKDGPLAEKLI